MSPSLAASYRSCSCLASTTALMASTWFKSAPFTSSVTWNEVPHASFMRSTASLSRACSPEVRPDFVPSSFTVST